MKRCRAGIQLLVGALIAPWPSITAQRPRPPERPALIAHEIIRAGVLERGLAAALEPMLRDDATLLWPGLPVVTGKARVTEALAAQQYPAGLRFQLQPLGVDRAADSSMVLIYGVAYVGMPDSSRGDLGRYIMAWHRRPNGWSLGVFGLVEMPGFPPGVLPDSLSPRGPESILTVGDGDPRPFVMADLAFADSAGRSSAADAFRHWAAPDAVTFATGGVLVRGPEAIADALRGMDGSHWSWRPVAAGAARDGSVGWTAGEAMITVDGVAGQPDRVLRSTYLSLWKRQEDGTIRFIADGGNVLP